LSVGQEYASISNCLLSAVNHLLATVYCLVSAVLRLHE
jgi:hypothetical protein